MGAAVRAGTVRRGALAMVLLLTLLVLPRPAQGMAAGVSLDCESTDCVTGTGYLVNATSSQVGGAVAFVCEISAPGASTVAITSCTSGPASAPRAGVPGPVAVTTGGGTVQGSHRYSVCWAGSATFVLGGRTVYTSGCSLARVDIDDTNLIPDLDAEILDADIKCLTCDIEVQCISCWLKDLLIPRPMEP